eukprot:CAMPEP_0119014742 /NCGR_PEP_ID=MMETSP1176-20130426/10341_1 /TAXON_ID=265551 /ORGANISM="Synedropsis recta cf, Strain CCMP1620" /LENGTH=346 /DNA_ID=CAMNT_0006967979 /DNA_START=39 /DNA_END=1079 /DNA_ORIENTATION=-
MRILTLLISLSFSLAFITPPRCPSTAFTLSATPMQEVFSDEFTEQIAADVTRAVNLPFVPSPVVAYILKQSIRKISTDLSKDTMERLQEVLQTEATSSTLDDLSKDEINSLADQVAKELNLSIDAPMLDEEQEFLVLQQIMRVVFSVITTNDKEKHKAFIKTNISASKDLLSSPESRKTLVAAINKAVDVPILDETQEATLIGAAVEASSDLVRSLLPPDLIETLKGETPESIGKMKEYVIASANEKLDIAGLSEDQERMLLEAMVSILIDTYVDNTEAEFLLMTPDEQKVKLKEMKETLERKKDLSQRRYEREQSNLAVQIERIDLRIKVLRRSRSWLARLFRRG